ncbi:MAG: hypothetical protein JST49_13350 [Bacteroidetes bacterium]|nr:hypothetical protein [Bacteroidota bacterium]
MQSLSKYVLVLFSILLLTQCSNNGKEVEGSWQIQRWQANGTDLPKAVYEGSTWTFEGSTYKVNIANIIDEGKYRMIADTLFMKSETTPERPEMHYILLQADSATLKLKGDLAGNKSEISFAKANLP